MTTSFKKITAYTVAAALGCLVLSPELATSQVSPDVNNITDSWRFAAAANSNPNYLRITHNTSSDTITGRIYNNSASAG